MPSPYKKSFAAEQLKQQQQQKKKTGLWIFLAFIGLVIIAAGYVLHSRFGTQEESIQETEQIKSIAVLPFRDISPENDQDYLGAGIAEMIINTLTNVEALRVIASTSSFAYKGQNKDIREIGRELDVETVLEGSVQKSGKRLRITAQLIKVSDHSHLFSRTFDKEFDDIFIIQDEISREILNELKFTLMGKEKAAIAKRYTNDPDAYELYLQGLNYQENFNKERGKRSLEYLQRAIDVDPEFALAYVGISNLYRKMSLYGIMREKDAFIEARAWVLKALEKDENLAEAHLSLAFINFYNDWDFPSAESGFLRAIELNPGSADAHNRYSHFLKAMGRLEEALSEIKRAIELDPLPHRNYGRLCSTYIFSGRYDEAIELALKSIEKYPDNVATFYWYLGRSYCEQGKYKEAIDAFTKFKEHIPISASAQAETWLGYAYGISGEKEKAEQIINTLKNQKKEVIIPSVFIATVYSGMGETDKAIEILEKAIVEKESFLLFIKGDPAYKNLRADPRFKELVKKIGLPE